MKKLLVMLMVIAFAGLLWCELAYSKEESSGISKNNGTVGLDKDKDKDKDKEKGRKIQKKEKEGINKQGRENNRKKARKEVEK